MDNLKAREREWGTHSLIDIETSIFRFANECVFFLIVHKSVLLNSEFTCDVFLRRIPLLYASNNSYFVSRVIAAFILLGEPMIVNNTFKYKVFVKTI